MTVVISMKEHRRSAGRPREHDLTRTPLGRWVLANFRGNWLDIARELGVDLSSLECIVRGEGDFGADLVGRFLAEVERRVCPEIASACGLKPATFAKYANGTLRPHSEYAIKIKRYSEHCTPESPLDLDALLDYDRMAA